MQYKKLLTSGSQSKAMNMSHQGPLGRQIGAYFKGKVSLDWSENQSRTNTFWKQSILKPFCQMFKLLIMVYNPTILQGAVKTEEEFEKRNILLTETENDDQHASASQYHSIQSIGNTSTQI